MSFTCLRDEWDWGPPARLSPFTSLWNMASGQDLVLRTPRWDSGYPPSCSPSRQLANATSVQPHENLSTCLVCVFCSYILSHGVLTKINLSLVLKGICIYKFGERILTWDLGDWEWSWLSHRHAEWFLENWRIFVDCNFLIEKIIKLDVVHRSKLC